MTVTKGYRLFTTQKKAQTERLNESGLTNEHGMVCREVVERYGLKGWHAKELLHTWGHRVGRAIVITETELKWLAWRDEGFREWCYKKGIELEVFA